MKFDLYGEKFIVSKERAAYNDIRQIFTQLAEEATDKFYDIYMEENSNLEDVYNNIDKQGDRALNKLINESIDILIINDIENISKKDFYKEYKNSLRYGFWDDAKNDMKEKYIEIELGKEELKKYREKRKENRAKSEDDSISIEEFKKTKESDEEAGFGKKLLDMVGNSVSKGIATIEKKSVFNDESNMEALLTGLYNSAYFIHYSLIDMIEEMTDKEYSWVSKVKKTDVENRLIQISKLELTDEEKIEIIMEMLDKDPYNEDIYKYAYDNFKDPKGELDKIAKFFGVDLYDYKLLDLEVYFNEINLELNHKETQSNIAMPKRFLGLMKATKDEQREQGYVWKPLRITLIELSRLYIIKYELIKYSEFIHLDLDNRVLSQMDHIIEEFMEDFRIVNGVIYDTFEEAVEAREEREAIENIMRELEVSEAGILAAIDEIKENCKLDLKDDYIDKLYEDLNMYIDEKIDSEIESKDFKSVEEIEAMKKYIKTEYNRYEVADKYEDILDKKIDDFIDDEILNLIKESNLNSIKAMEDMIDFIDENYDNPVKNKHISKLEGDILIEKGKEKIGQVVDKGKNMVKGLFNGLVSKKDKDEVRVISKKEEENLNEDEIIDVSPSEEELEEDLLEEEEIVDEIDEEEALEEIDEEEIREE